MGTLILLVLSIALFYPDKEAPQPQVIQEIPQPQSAPQEPEPSITETSQSPIITAEELAKHSTEGDCWITYSGKVYDYSQADLHPNMAKTFFSHCGQTTGFQEGATSKHGSKSSETRVSNYGNYIGDLI